MDEGDVDKGVPKIDGWAHTDREHLTNPAQMATPGHSLGEASMIATTGIIEILSLNPIGLVGR